MTTWNLPTERLTAVSPQSVIIAVPLLLALLVMVLMPRVSPLGEEARQGAFAGEVAPPAAVEAAVAEPVVEEAAPAEVSLGGGISAVFAPSVQYWAEDILRWSAEHGVDPNLAAIIMQIESCGDPQAISIAGAQGLFQVMPFHFVAGENSLDPNTNAFRGLNYFVERLAQTSGDVGRAFAGYNGGHVAAGSSWDAWADETKRYYVWSTGIHADIQAGLTNSPTLERWMAAGGASLCQQAANRLGI